MNETVPAPDRERAYFSAIEAAFIARRGTPFLLSPRDFAIMRRWNDLSVPVEDVLAGIDEAFDRHVGRGSLSRINSLAYCEGAVLEAWERRSAARAGASGKPPEAEPDLDLVLTSLRENLMRIAAAEPRLAGAAGAAAISIERASARERTPSAWDEKLRRLEKQFLATAEAVLTEEEHSRLEASIASSLAGEAERMSAEALRRTVAVLRRRWLRNTFDTPRFSLLS